MGVCGGLVRLWVLDYFWLVTGLVRGNRRGRPGLEQVGRRGRVRGGGLQIEQICKMMTGLCFDTYISDCPGTELVVRVLQSVQVLQVFCLLVKLGPVCLGQGPPLV